MSKLDNFDRAKVGYDRMEAHDNHIWNEAIEAAANEAGSYDSRFESRTLAAIIRELKK